MKKELYLKKFLFIFLAFFFVYGASALDQITCSTPSQKIFAISDTINAHAESGNLQPPSKNYLYEICYNDYFTQAYAGANPRNCVPTTSPLNTVIRLSGSTDAHAEGPEKTTQGYVNYCYGNLSCFLQSPQKNCNESPGDASYSQIVSLSDDTNAHLALGRFYDYTICCKSLTSGHGPICNYDGVCSGAETEQNCPECSFSCGDGLIEGLERCDGNNLGGKQCSDFEGYTGENLGCYPQEHNQECTFNLEGCNFTQCNDGIDNDIDGLIDSLDPGCWNEVNTPSSYNKSINSESRATSQCQDEIDNDDDDRIDYPSDAGCTSSQDNSETECGNNEKELGEQCDCGSNGCDGTVLGVNCNSVSSLYKEGKAGCTSQCTYNFSECTGYKGFCIDNAPFEYMESSGAWVAPSTCQDYNLVYPGNSPTNDTKRKELCERNCVPGASDPVNNGIGGLDLIDWGCAYDQRTSPPNSGVCYFWYNETSNPSQSCRLDYTVLEDCGQDKPFRKVRVSVQAISEGGGCTDAGCGSSSCETEIMCPRVIELPFFGTGGLISTIIILVLIYGYILKKK